MNAKQEVLDHFADVSKMVDSKKDEIAFAMNYFAVQTRKQELLEQRLKER